MMRSCQTNKAKLFVVCWCPAVPELDYHQLAKRVVKAGKNFNKSQHLCNLMPQGSTACRCDAQPLAGAIDQPMRKDGPEVEMLADLKIQNNYWQ